MLDLRSFTRHPASGLRAFLCGIVFLWQMPAHVVQGETCWVRKPKSHYALRLTYTIQGHRSKRQEPNAHVVLHVQHDVVRSHKRSTGKHLSRSPFTKHQRHSRGCCTSDCRAVDNKTPCSSSVALPCYCDSVHSSPLSGIYLPEPVWRSRPRGTALAVSGWGRQAQSNPAPPARSHIRAIIVITTQRKPWATLPSALMAVCATMGKAERFPL